MLAEESSTLSTDINDPPPPSKGLNRIHGTAMVMGSMFGVGIFLYPPLTAKHTGSFGLFLLAWLLGGLISFLGALAYSELGVRFPKAGGDYTFHRSLLGDSVGFASGWLLFLGIFSGSIATMTSALIYFQLSALVDWNFGHVLFAYPWGGSLTLSELMACAIIVTFTVSNAVSVRLSGNLQIVLTVLPIATVLMFCFYGLGFYDGTGAAAPSPPSENFDFIKAYLLIYFAYAGWNAVVYFGGDFERPRRDIPISLLLGTGITTAVYFIMGSAFVAILGFGGLQQVPEAGTAIAGVLGGKTAQTVMTALIGTAILASINGTVLAGGKTGYAMARDGTVGFSLPKNHDPKKWQTIFFLIQAVWSTALILTGGFEALTELTSLAMLVTAGLSMIALLKMRRYGLDEKTLYRFKGFLFAPWTFLLINCAVLAVSIANALEAMNAGDEGSWKAWYSLLGLIIFGGLLAGHWTKQRITSSTAETTN